MAPANNRVYSNVGPPSAASVGPKRPKEAWVHPAREGAEEAFLRPAGRDHEINLNGNVQMKIITDQQRSLHLVYFLGDS